MISTDPIADMLTRIRNGLLVNKQEVSVPHSKLKQSVAELLKENHYLSGVKIVDEDNRKNLSLSLKATDANSTITEIKRLSSPGRRSYVSAKEIPRVKQGRGIVIISTSQGIMTGTEARRQNVGGELICEVY